MLTPTMGTNSSNLLFEQTQLYFNMDTLIMFVKVEGFLKNPPSLVPHPDFTGLRVLRCNMIEVLNQLSCPQSAIHEWARLIMHPTMYALI
jgi:hypothetical protein